LHRSQRIASRARLRRPPPRTPRLPATDATPTRFLRARLRRRLVPRRYFREGLHRAPTSLLDPGARTVGPRPKDHRRASCGPHTNPRQRSAKPGALGPRRMAVRGTPGRREAVINELRAARFGLPGRDGKSALGSPTPPSTTRRVRDLGWQHLGRKGAPLRRRYRSGRLSGRSSSSRTMADMLGWGVLTPLMHDSRRHRK